MACSFHITHKQLQPLCRLAHSVCTKASSHVYQIILLKRLCHLKLLTPKLIYNTSLDGRLQLYITHPEACIQHPQLVTHRGSSAAPLISDLLSARSPRTKTTGPVPHRLGAEPSDFTGAPDRTHSTERAEWAARGTSAGAIWPSLIVAV